jgi:hypothetical protein
MEVLGGEAEETALFLPVMRKILLSHSSRLGVSVLD